MTNSSEFTLRQQRRLDRVFISIGSIPNGGRAQTDFFLTVAGSGERKSATDSLALRPIRKHEEILLETYAAELPGYNNAKAAWDAARKKACWPGSCERYSVPAAEAWARSKGVTEAEIEAARRCIPPSQQVIQVVHAAQ